MIQPSNNRTGLACVDRGQGVPLVLLHGFPLNGAMWNAQIDPLATHCRVLVPDLPGFGRNTPTPPGQTTTMEQMADDVAALLDFLKINQPIVLAGLSMGGYVALAFHKKSPQRLRAVVLCDTRAAADAPATVQSRHAVAQKILAEGTGVLADSMLPRLFSPSTLHNRPQLVDRTREMVLQADPHSTAAALRGMAQRTDSTPMLPDIHCPVLVLVGADDLLSPPAEMQAMAQAIPHAQVVEIAEAGHLSPLEQPAQFNAALLDFLAGLPT